MPSVSRPIDPTQADIAFHPFADIFPMMDEVALAELAADIKAESQREPIHLWQDQIIDGRNRYAACKLAGVEPIIKKIEFPGGDAEALAYVLSRNLKRRHLSVTQRSDVARRLANMRQGERTDLAQPSDAASEGRLTSRSSKYAGGVAAQRGGRQGGPRAWLAGADRRRRGWTDELTQGRGDGAAWR